MGKQQVVIKHLAHSEKNCIINSVINYFNKEMFFKKGFAMYLTKCKFLQKFMTHNKNTELPQYSNQFNLFTSEVYKCLLFLNGWLVRYASV